MRSLRSFALALLLLAAAASPALAHDPATMDSMPAPHGGQLRMTGPFHLELVLEPTRVTLHVMDHANQPIDVAGGRATARFTVDGETTELELLPIAEAAFGREGKIPAGEGLVVDVTVALSGQREWTVTFTPQATAKPAG